MRYLPPIPWHSITPGTVVLDANGTPRTVIAAYEHALGSVTVLLEGCAPQYYPSYYQVMPVELDTADAIGNLHTAGFTVTPIEGN
jgi:hypothetical protein